MIVVAELSAMAFATSFVPTAKTGFSKMPIGPFQMTVFADLIASANSLQVLGPMSAPSRSAGMESTSTVIVSTGASMGLGNSAMVTQSTGNNNFLSSACALAIISLQ